MVATRRAPTRQPSPHTVRQRLERRQDFLRAARDIVNAQGADALTMRHVTRAVGTSEGGIYNYFPTRSALLAELEIEALETIIASSLAGQQHLDDLLDRSSLDATTAALVRAVGLARFWIASEQTLPSEVELSRRVFSQPEAISEPTDTGRLIVTALQLLDHGRQRLDGAVVAGVLVPGENVERSLMLIASMTGALLTSKLGGWDHHVFDGAKIARQVAAAIFAGWGARWDLLDAAEVFLADVPLDLLAPPAPGLAVAQWAAR